MGSELCARSHTIRFQPKSQHGVAADRQGGQACTSSWSSSRSSRTGAIAGSDLVDSYTAATRAEPGNLFFEWSRSVEDENTFVLVEGFTDDGAGPHVNSDHFKQALVDLPQALARTPQIISKQVDGEGWGPMGELQID